MKKALLSAALAGSLFLGSCTALTNLPTQISTVTTQTQAIAQTLCQFLPTASTIAAIAASLFPGGGPIETVASGVANSICNALTSVPLSAVKGRHGALKASVNGIPIDGHYTK